MCTDLFLPIPFPWPPFLKLPGEMKKLCLLVSGKIYTAKHEHAARELLSQMDLTNIAITMKTTIVIYSPFRVITEKEREKCTCL